MKSPFVSELQPNQVITGTFLVVGKEIRQKKTGEPFLSLTLGDKTGDLDAKMWDNVTDVLDTFERDHFIKVKGLLQVYQNKPQLTIHKLIKVAESDVDPADYFPASERDRNEMFAELRGLIAEMTNVHLRGLLEALFADEEIARRYRSAPAAKSIHHAYLGGLIEHVLSLCALCKLTAPHYRDIDLDLLLTGAILHDIGKIYELSYERSFTYSNDGQLLGHIIIGLRLVSEKLRELPAFPPKLRSLVEHMIVSHHGELEFGSPKVPVFPEALLLHHLDNLDSKMECMRRMIEKDRHVEGCWTGYSPSLERTALKKARYYEAAPVAASAAAPAPATAAAGPGMTVPPPAVQSASSRPSAPPQASLFGEKLLSALRPKE
ncbi:MAG: HD domain-containing protein [Bryobacteraceae bacterium]|nr:HD domain-containing protein [Bryobacteraceae bacterium]